jgi:hypothetical protein
MIPARMRPGRPVITAAVAVTALISGAGVALAATSSPSAPQQAPEAGTAAAKPSPSASPPRCQIKLPGRGFPAPGPIAAAPGVPGPFGFGMFGAIHGQFVAPKPGGGYQTVDTQRGTVTAVSTNSVTVKSSDGYTKTYRVTSSTIVDAQRGGIASVKTGQTVSVLATVSGSSATAVQIADFSALSKLPQILKPGPGHMFPVRPCADWKISQSPS